MSHRLAFLLTLIMMHYRVVDTVALAVTDKATMDLHKTA